MSVLIKGMNMPYGCANCDFVGSPVYDSKGRAICSCNVPVENLRGKDVTDHVIAMYEGARMSFPKWCPLVDLGKHGRLVEFIDVVKTLDEDSGTEEVCFGDIMRAYYEMRNAPTIVEAEDGE